MTTGMRALRKACFHMTRRSGTPLARAVLMYSSFSTSRKADKVKRAMMAATVAPKVKDGRTSSDHFPVNPATGAHPRWTAKSWIASSPSQNCGREMPETEISMAVWSCHLPL